jgi:hypothetical protein
MNDEWEDLRQKVSHGMSIPSGLAGRMMDEIERLRSALELIACGGDPNFEQDPAFDYGTNVAMHLQQIAREALKDD